MSDAEDSVCASLNADRRDWKGDDGYNIISLEFSNARFIHQPAVLQKALIPQWETLRWLHSIPDWQDLQIRAKEVQTDFFFKHKLLELSTQTCSLLPTLPTSTIWARTALSLLVRLKVRLHAWHKQIYDYWFPTGQFHPPQAYAVVTSPALVLLTQPQDELSAHCSKAAQAW